jgi:hypothetical protein
MGVAQVANLRSPLAEPGYWFSLKTDSMRNYKPS